jgi:hypothetical protein
MPTEIGFGSGDVQTRGQRSEAGDQRSDNKQSKHPARLRCNQLDLDFAPKRSGSAVQGRQRDGRIFGIEQSMDRSSGRPHSRRHCALVDAFLFHQVVDFQRESTFESSRVYFVMQALRLKKLLKAASAMLVLTSCWF